MSFGTAFTMLLGGVVIGFALAALTPWHGVADDVLARLGYTRATAPSPSPVPSPAPPAPEPAEPEEAEPEPRDESAPAVADEADEAGTKAPSPNKVRRGSASAPEKKRRVRQPAAAASSGDESATGVLQVTAPDGTEIFLDGRRIGSGSVRKQIRAGAHRIDARLGRAKIGEGFRVLP